MVRGSGSDRILVRISSNGTIVAFSKVSDLWCSSETSREALGLVALASAGPSESTGEAALAEVDGRWQGGARQVLQRRVLAA